MFSLAWILFLLKVTPFYLFHLGLPVRGKKPILSVSSTQSVTVSHGRTGPGDLVKVERLDREEVRRLMIALSSDHTSDSFLGRRVGSREGAS